MKDLWHHRRHGFATQRWLIGAALILGLILIGIPGVQREAARERAELYERKLMRIQLAKEAYALEHELEDSAKITMNQLQAQDRFLEGQVYFPPRAELHINPVGTQPQLFLDGRQYRPIVRDGQSSED